MLYHTDEKLKIFDSKPIYEAYQATIDLKSDVSDKVDSNKVDSNVAASNNTASRPQSLSEFYHSKSSHRMMIDILGLGPIFYQR